MTNKRSVFEEILLLPGAAPVLAAKISGRIIGRIADGFDQDPALYDMMCLFRCLENKWPEQTMSLRDMYNLQMKDAKAEAAQNEASLDSLTPEQRDLWMKERTSKQSRVDKLEAALPKIIDLHTAAIDSVAAWNDLTPINQWSLLNAVERGVHKRRARYAQWAKEDDERGKTESKNYDLLEDVEEAIKALSVLITKFLSTPDIADALTADADNGIRVPTRFVA
jgi:hypothetical protein